MLLAKGSFQNRLCSFYTAAPQYLHLGEIEIPDQAIYGIQLKELTVSEQYKIDYRYSSSNNVIIYWLLSVSQTRNGGASVLYDIQHWVNKAVKFYLVRYVII